MRKAATTTTRLSISPARQVNRSSRSPPFKVSWAAAQKAQKAQKQAKSEKPKAKNTKHTTAGIRWWSPTQLLICRFEACVWQSGRDAQFSSIYGRM